MAGASLWAARLSGKLNGLMAAIGPIGKRRVMPTRSLRGRQQVERDELAGHALRFLGPQPEGECRAVDLDERIADGLAGLEGDEPAQFLTPSLDARADLAQDPAALVGGQVAGHLERGHRGLDGFLVLGLGRVERRAGRGRGIGRVGDDEWRIGLDPAAGEEDGVRLDAGDDGHHGAPARFGLRYRRILHPDPDEPSAKGARDGATDRPARRPARPTRQPCPPRQARSRGEPRLGQGDRGTRARAPARPIVDPPGPVLGRREALGARRAPGHRCRRQGRDHQQGHGGLQPPGRVPSRVSRSRARRSSPTTTCGGSTSRYHARARSGSSTARTTRTS